MKMPKLSIVFRLFDFLLWPFMWILGGFVFPVQETHSWHVKKHNWGKSNGLHIKEKDTTAKFGHESSLGLFHMPIFGGLTRYVVVEASGFDKYWNVGWEGYIHKLRIKENKIMMLTGKHGFIMYGLGDNGRNLKMKIVRYGNLGDGKYNDLRLF